MPYRREIEPAWRTTFAAPYVHVIFRARQTGKSTRRRRLLPSPAVGLDFSQPAERAEFLRDPDRLVGICRALPTGKVPADVLIDEAQNVPAIFDAVQHL